MKGPFVRATDAVRQHAAGGYSGSEIRRWISRLKIVTFKDDDGRLMMRDDDAAKVAAVLDERAGISA